MAKNEKTFLEEIEDFKNNCNPNHHGKNGDLFEGYTKAYIGNFKGSMVSAAGRRDTTKKIGSARFSFEMKTGSGELATLNADGTVKHTCLTADYMIYCYKFNPDEPVETQAYVFPMGVFTDILETLNLIGYKYSTPMTKRPVPERYYDKVAIKQMSTAKRTKCRENFIDTYESLGMTLEDFARENF